MVSVRGAAFHGMRCVAFALALLPVRALAQSPTSAPPATTSEPPSATPAVAPPLAPAARPQPTVQATSRPHHLPRPPPDPTSAAVYTVLEKHCARCHQDGRLDRPAPAGAFGNVLRLDELATAPHLVQPGNPDASRLYLMMLRRLMPISVNAEGAPPVLPTSDEVALVRSWIAGLPTRQECRDRRPVTVDDHAATLLQLKNVTSEDPKKLRFLSIAHLHNGCIRSDALAAYRQAIVRLFNSLSWKAAPVAVPPVDPARTLFKINLDDLGWLPEHWERIMRAGSSPLGLTAPLPTDVRQAFGTEIPVARADWFAKTVLSAPLYYEVLGLPGTGPEILKILQIAPTSGGNDSKVLRAVTAPSSFSVQPSLVERHQSRSGPIWQAYHWLAGEDAPEIDPDNIPALADLSPPYHATRGMFTLPNGLPGFFVTGQRGDRLDALPPTIANPTVSGHTQITGGLDCMTCHRRGPASIAALDAGSPPPHARVVTADRKAISDATRRIGIDPDLTLDGVAPIVALAEEYARPLDGARAAAELGIELSSLRDLGDRGPDAASVLARRLMQGLVARVEVEAHAGQLSSALGRPQLALPESEPSGQAQFTSIDRGPGLVLYSDKTRYHKGDSLQVTVHVASDCHLTVVSIDTRGRGTVLFPSDFETNSLLTAGQELKLPGPDAAYSLRLNETGRETIVALCNEASALTDNIHYDFERQRFTELGDYAAFLVHNAFAAPSDATTTPTPGTLRRVRRRNHAAAVPDIHARPDQISRTAISIIVE
ncbi:MAG: DUF4384 domain-containing protein [Hyphomicrobiaceae bacterium]